MKTQVVVFGLVSVVVIACLVAGIDYFTMPDSLRIARTIEAGGVSFEAIQAAESAARANLAQAEAQAANLRAGVEFVSFSVGAAGLVVMLVLLVWSYRPK